MNDLENYLDSTQNDHQEKIYRRAMPELAEMAVEMTERKCAWFRHLLLLTVTLYGILISLQSKEITSHHIRWCFVLITVLFVIAIMAGGISVYSELWYSGRARKMYQENALKAFRDGCEIGSISVPTNKLFVYAEITFYCSLVLGIIFVSAYSLMTIFGF